MINCVITLLYNKIEWFKLLGVGAQMCLAGCAYMALSTWRREHLDKKKIDLAEEIVIQMGIIRDLLHWVRNGFAYNSETDEILQDLKNQKEQGVAVKINGNILFYLVPSWRLTKNNEKISSFLNLRYKADIYWGEPCLKLFDRIDGIIFQIKNACRFLYTGKNEKKTDYYTDIIWSDYTDNDKINRELDEIYEEFKSNLEPLYLYKRTAWKSKTASK